MKKALKTAPRGTAFNYAGQRWVVLEHNATGTLCLTEKIVEDRAFDDGNCNDFSKSSSLRYLNGPFLDTLIDAAGCSSAFLTSELDLTADDGLKDYHRHHTRRQRSHRSGRHRGQCVPDPVDQEQDHRAAAQRAGGMGQDRRRCR